MQSKLIAFLILIFALTLSLAAFTSADLPVGVKAGDWIEYNVTYTGNPAAGHNIVWARMQVISVMGPYISVEMTSRFEDNSTTVTNSTLNLETGDLIDDFIIPANLSAGQTFLDKNLGNVTIRSEKQQTYAGATRTVVSSSTITNTYVWDQKTGVSVEGTAQETTYSLHTVVADTNMWQPDQPITSPLTPIVLAITIAIIVVATLGLVSYLKKNSSKSPPAKKAHFVKP